MSRNHKPVECHGTPHPIDSKSTVTCCAEAAALLEECGDMFGLYSNNLGTKGWPGQLSKVERAYVRAHRSEASSKAARTAGERLAKSRFLPPKHTTQTALVEDVVSGPTSVPSEEDTLPSDGDQTAKAAA